MTASSCTTPAPVPALGIDLGGSSVKFAWFTSDGTCAAKGNTPFEAANPMEWAQHIQAIIRSPPPAIDPHHLHVGVSAPGLASADGRRIACMPGRLQGLVDLDWTELLQRPSPVPVLNDAHAALLGECWLGAGRQVSNAILLTLGTGVGGAIMVDGKLLRGHLGRAGHLGHISLDILAPPDICGVPGSLEMMIGNCSILERSGGRYQTTHDLLKDVAAHDPKASQIWSLSVHYLACAIASFINITDPQRVIIGGGIARAGHLLFDPLREHLSHIEWRPLGNGAEIVPAQLGEFAGAYGASRASLPSS